MTLEQLITCYMRKSSKIVVTKITPCYQLQNRD